jgi:signal transduction histidine kinase
MLFELTFHPIILPFLFAFFISLMLSIYAFRIRHNATVRIFAWYAAAIAVWQITSVFEIASVEHDAKLFWTSVKYLGSASAPVLGLFLSLSATRKSHLLQKRLFTFPVWIWGIATMLVVWTNDWHHWYWSRTFLSDDAFDINTEKAWWFGIYAAGMYLSITASTVMYLTYVRKAPALYKKQAYWFAIGGFLPLGFRLLSDFFGIVIIRGADQVVLLMLITVGFYGVALFRYNAFRLIPVAYDQIVHQLDSPVLVYDQNNYFLDANEAAFSLFELNLTESIGKNIHALTDVDDWAVYQNSEWWSTVGDHARCFQVTRSELRDGVQLLGYSLLLTEITRLKETEERLAAANREKQQMTADLAHDLRTPIQIVSGYLEALDDGMIAPTSERYQSMQRQMGNLSKLVTDIMVLAKSDAGDLQLTLEEVDLIALVQSVCDDFQTQVDNQHIALTIKPAPMLPTLTVDAGRIEQVMQNLLRNAMTHTPEGGTIQVGCIMLDNGMLECTVADSGVGLLPEHLSLVFDRAFRVSEDRATEQSSNGLGLAICKSLIEAHGGVIGVRSDGINQGATFWFRLPIRVS